MFGKVNIVASSGPWVFMDSAPETLLIPFAPRRLLMGGGTPPCSCGTKGHKGLGTAPWYVIQQVRQNFQRYIFLRRGGIPRGQGAQLSRIARVASGIVKSITRHLLSGLTTLRSEHSKIAVGMSPEKVLSR